jgi:hypothetical protein
MVLWALVLIGVVGMPAVTAYGLYRRSPGRAAVLTVVWAAWIVVSAILAGNDVYRQSAVTTKPWIAVAAVGALIVALLVMARADIAIWPHTFRVVGAVFLVALALGKLPAVFALPAGLGDIAIGLSAPFIARRLARGDRTGAVWFNVLGLLDLTVAVSIGFLAGLGPARLLDVSPSTAQIALLPLVLIPTTAVPLAIALHITALARLRPASVHYGRSYGLTGRRVSTPEP